MKFLVGKMLAFLKRAASWAKVAAIAVIILGVAIGVYYGAHPYIEPKASPTPTPVPPSPSPSPTPWPPPYEAYAPSIYWNTLLAEGFEEVEPRIANMPGSVFFTISKGKTGVATIEAKVIKIQHYVNLGDTFNVSFSPKELPEWVNVTFDPPQFIVGKEQKVQVKVTITVSPAAPTTLNFTDKKAIFYTTTVNAIGQTEQESADSKFYLIIID